MRAMVRGAHFLAVAAMSAVGAAPGAVDEGLLAKYDLLRADCVNGTFPDGAGAGGPLVRTASTRCLHGLGVAADGAAPRVTAGAAALRDALGASASDGSDGLTVELWLRLDGVGESTVAGDGSADLSKSRAPKSVAPTSVAPASVAPKEGSASQSLVMGSAAKSSTFSNE